MLDDEAVMIGGQNEEQIEPEASAKTVRTVSERHSEGASKAIGNDVAHRAEGFPRSATLGVGRYSSG